MNKATCVFGGESDLFPTPRQPERAAAVEQDPRKLFETENIGSIEDVEVGDFITCSWTRPRRVVMADVRQGGRTIWLAEPDTSRVDNHGNRMVDANEWARRGSWTRFPNLRALWDAAHGGG